ncbi:MAG: hypothetical protein J7J78_00475 [Thermoprotei archaeon]|nr:hypothetical protein [Thermoprotei archaeon]
MMDIHILSKEEKEIIKIIEEHGELTFDELKNYVKIEKPKLREIIAEMLRKGLLVKVPNFERGKFVYKVSK